MKPQTLTAEIAKNAETNKSESMKTEGAESRIGRPSSAMCAHSAVEGLTLEQAESPEQIAAIRELFLEYAQSLNFSLCFQSFEEEIAGLPGDYAPPEGRLILVTFESQAAGGV